MRPLFSATLAASYQDVTYVSGASSRNCVEPFAGSSGYALREPCRRQSCATSIGRC